MCKKLFVLTSFFLVLALAGTNATFGGIVWEGRVSQDSDNSEELDPEGNPEGSSSDLEFPYEDAGMGEKQLLAIRWQDVDVPKGATIVDAWIEFQVKELKDSTLHVSVIIEGELNPNPPTFTFSAFEIADKQPRTTAQAIYEPEYWTAVDANHQTSNIAVVIEEIVNQPGWASGNALVLIIRDNPANPSKGIRCAKSYAGDAAAAPLLHIESSSKNATQPDPSDGAIDVPQDAVLSWAAGTYADKHDVYFGTISDDVNESSRTNPQDVLVGQNQEDTTYDPPGLLEFGQSYYWRVDEFNDTEPNSPWKGNTWSFRVIDHFIVDDFEDYNDYPPNEIFSTWLDGWEDDTNGATVGHDADFTKGENIVETTIVHRGKQSMPFYYDNSGTANYSEAERVFSPAQDWTREGVGILSLWFRGHPAYVDSFTEGPAGTYTMTASGEDIWDNSDQFHFAWKEVSGAASIVAKVESVQNVHEWAKAGVMIRDTLEADSRHAMVAITPGNGVWFGRRETAGGSSVSTKQADITAPQWVKMERTVGGLVRAYYSADGTAWTQLDAASVMMNKPMYIGLALTSHDAALTCEAKFSNVTSDGTGQWGNQDIGMLSNEPEPMYVSVQDGSGTSATVYHDDPDASLINTWTEWNIDLKDFGDAGIVLTDVSNLAIGFGDADNPQPGGTGTMYFDDIALN